LSFSLLALSLSACNEPINPDDLADRVARHAREVVHQSGGGVAFAGESDSGLQKLADGMNGAGDGLAGAMPAPVPPGMMSSMSGSPMAMAMLGMPSMLTTEEQFDETADDLRLWLRERILTAQNLESQSDDEAIYLLRADPTCRALPVDGDPPGVIPPLDTGCADDLTRLAVRVALRADGDGGRLTILIGPERLELSQFVVHSDLIAVEVDLPKAYAATQAIEQALGTESPTPTRFEALSGRLRLALQKLGDKKVVGSFSVLQAIAVATLDSSGAVGPDVRLAATNPTLSVTADGVNQTLAVNVNLGALDVLGDWDPMGIAPPNRDLHVGIGGIYGQATFTEAMDAIVATGVGVGASKVDVRGATIFDLGLNPNDARKFDVRLSLDAAGRAQAEITPRFDLAMGFHLGRVASEYTSPPPSHLLDEVYGVKLDNGGAAATVVAMPATSSFGGGVKIAAGTLTISSTAAPSSPVVVPAGRCLTGASEAPAGSHPVLGAFSVVDCPVP
jgi:hypothetical protein